MNVEKTSSPANRISIAMNSSSSRCGHVCTRSPCSRSTRWIPSGGTSASRRCLSGAPFLGVGRLPVGSGASRRGRGDRRCGHGAPRRPLRPRRRPRRQARRRGGRAAAVAARAAAAAALRASAACAAASSGMRGAGTRGSPWSARGPRRRAGRCPRPAAASSTAGRRRGPCWLLPSSCAPCLLLTAAPRCRRPCGSARSGPRGTAPARTAARARAARTSAAACSATRSRRPAAGSSPASR